MPGGAPGWLLRDQFDPAREHEVESRFAIGNGFIGVRAARAASRGPVWISWLRSLNWTSWPRTFVAGLFDTPDTQANIPLLVPAPDWLRLRLLLDGQPLFIYSGELIAHQRVLDLRRGLLLSDWSQRDTAGRVVRMRTLRLVSQADRAVGLQVARIEIDQPVEVTLQSWLELAGAGLEPVSVRRNSAVWRTAASQDRGKYLGLAITARLSLRGQVQPAQDRGKLKQAWHWTARPGEPATFWRAVSMKRGDAEHDPGQRRGPRWRGHGSSDHRACSTPTIAPGPSDGGERRRRRRRRARSAPFASPSTTCSCRQPGGRSRARSARGR